MAERTTTTKPRAQKASTTKAETEATPVQEAKQAPEQKPIVPKEIDLHQYVTVRNGARGKLVYVSPRTKEKFVWEGFGDEQEMELAELRNAKAANKKYFERNWFMFDEDFAWVVDFLGVRAFYRYSIGVDEYDDLFQKSPTEIKKILGSLNKWQKRSVAYKAQQLIADGKIDSIKMIDALEKSLGVELIEK